jgi:hypothetical protein
LKSNLTILILISIFSFTACNKNDGNPSALPKLANSQVKKIMQALSSLGQVANSKRETQQIGTSNPRKELLVSKLLNAMATPPSSGEVSINPIEETASERAQVLEKMINETNCVFNYPNHENKLELVGQNPQLSGQADGSQISIPTFKLEISGPNCPAVINLEMQGTADEKSINAQFSWKFKAISETFIKETEITELNLIGNITMTANTQNPNLFAMVMNMAFTGSGFSKAQGNFSLDSHANINMEMANTQQGNGQPGANPAAQSFHLSESDSTTLTADGKALSFGHTSNLENLSTAPTEEFFIDGNKVSQMDYVKTVGDFKIPGLEGIGSGASKDNKSMQPSPRNPGSDPINSPPANSSLECKSTFFRSYEYSIEDLKRYAEVGIEAPTNITTSSSMVSTQAQTDLYGIAKAQIRYEIFKYGSEVSILIRDNNGKIDTSPTFHYDPLTDGSNKSDAYTVGEFLAYVYCHNL